MAYPERPWWVPTRLELAFGADPADPSTWEWTDVSGDLDRTQPIQIRRGRPNEAGQPSPASASPRLVNNSGNYTPGHPLGAYYPLVRQGVPARISVQAGGPHLAVPDTTGGRARTPSSTALNVTSDLDMRIEVAPMRLPARWGATPPSGFRPYAQAAQELMGRYVTGSSQMWLLQIDSSGAPRLGWSTTGTDYTEGIGTTLPVVSGQRIAIRATLDVDNGAGQHVVTFYTAPSLAGPWRVLGDPVVRAGTTSIWQAGSAPLDIGDVATVGFRPGSGRYYRAEVRNGIDGPLLAAPDFTAQTPGAPSFTDSAGRTWTVSSPAAITDWRTRMVGEVAEWAPTWPWGDLSDLTRPEERPGEARTDITVAGILRRLGQGAKPLQSTLRRRIPSYAPTAYWPLEEERTATQAYSPVEGVRPMAVSAVSFASDDTLPGSSALPSLEEGAAFRAVVPSAPSGAWRVAMVYLLDAMPSSGSQQVLDVRTTGSPWNRFEIRATSTPAVQVIGYDTTSESSASTLLINATPTDFAGQWSKLYLSASMSGSTVTISLRWLTVGGSGFIATSTYTGTAGRVTQILGAGMPQGMRIGHLAAFPVADTAAYESADTGFTGERAIARLRRLAEEENLPISVPGVTTESAAMGPQRPATLLELVQECVDADGGILGELREVPGLHYRPRYLLYNQRPALELSARANEIDDPFSPILDDQRLRNDITVTRDGGSSARAVDDQSVAERGLYDDSVTVNVADDGQVEPIAYWRLYRGTWPGMRYPAVTSALDLAPQTIDAWLDRAEGDRITVGDLPPQHPADNVDLLVEGLTETLSPTRWSIEANASPGGVWTVGEVGGDDPDGDAPTHVDTDGSELNAAVTATDTQLIVLTTAGPEWATTHGPAPTAGPGDYPFDVRFGGEVATVGAVEPMMWDDFGRTMSGGWGTTPSAIVPTPSWSLSGGSPAERSVAAGQGRVILGDTTVPRFQFLSTWQVPTCEQLVTVTVPVVATGAALRAGIAMRILGSDWYEVRANLAVGGALGIEVARTGTSLTGVIATGLTYSAGSVLRIRARVEGQRVRGRVWLAAQPEPGGWQVDYTVTTGTIATGQLGLVASRATGNTNTSPQFAFSAYQVVTPQLMTVIRSINHIAKSHASGTDSRLADPAIVAL